MVLSYDELARNLNLHESYESEADLATLRQWCNENFVWDFSSWQELKPTEEYQLLQNLAKEYLDLFLPRSSDINEPNVHLQGYTPIEWASIRGYGAFLRQHMNDVNPENGRTPLHRMAALGNKMAVEVLLELGASNLADKQGMFPIHCVLVLPMSEMDPEVREEKIALRTAIYELLASYAPESVLEITKDKQNVAHYMAKYGFEQLLDQLVKKNSELLVGIDSKGYPPACYAILNSRLGSLKILLQDERVRNWSDPKLGNLLSFAEKEGDKDAVDACLAAGIKKEDTSLITHIYRNAIVSGTPPKEDESSTLHP